MTPAGVAGAQPMRGESEGSPLSFFSPLPSLIKIGAEQPEKDAQPRRRIRESLAS